MKKEDCWRRTRGVWIEFECDGEMYGISLDDESDLLVSPEHRVYAKFIPKSSLTSLSSNTLITSCLFNLGSLDQIGVLLSSNDKAKSGLSFECGENFSTSSKNLLYSSLGTGVMNVENKVEKKNKTASSLNLDCLDITDSLFLISSNTSCGENNPMPLLYNSNMMSKTSPLIIPDINTFVSMISIYNPCLLATPSLINSPNSCAFFSDNLDLEAIDFNNLFCNSTLAQCSKDFSIRSSAKTALDSFSASCSYSSGTCNFKLISFIDYNNPNEYLNLSDFFLMRISDVYEDLENSANSLLDNPLGFEIISTPFCLRNVSNLFFTFSSNKNFILCWNQFEFSFSKLSSELQSCFNMLFFEGDKKIAQNFFNRSSSFKQLKYLPNHDSCALKSGSASTNLTVCNNIFVNFNSHNISNASEIYKDFALMQGNAKVMQEEKEEK